MYARKKLDYGVRFNADTASECEIPISLPGASGKFRLLSLPLYMVNEYSLYLTVQNLVQRILFIFLTI